MKNYFKMMCSLLAPHLAVYACGYAAVTLPQSPEIYPRERSRSRESGRSALLPLKLLTLNNSVWAQLNQVYFEKKMVTKW